MAAAHPELAGVAQVFARDVRLPEGAPLTFLARGEAAARRPDARAGHLICPLSSCPSPALTTSGGSRRDHFKHMTGSGGHGKETLAHHTGKHLIARWLRVQLGEAVSIIVDREEVENGQRPDVLLTFPDGRQVAYEVQFAALTPEEWLRRHRGYREQGIRDVWLFGGPRHLRRPRSSYADENDLAMTVLFATVLSEQSPVLLLDPMAERVALGTGHLPVRLLAGEQAHWGGEYQPAWVGLDAVVASHGMPLLSGWLQMKRTAQDRRARREAAERERRAWLAPLEQAWSSTRDQLIATAAAPKEVLELLEQAGHEERISRALGLLAPHWRWLALNSCPDLRPGAIVSWRTWAQSFASSIGIDTRNAQASTGLLHAGAAISQLLPLLRRGGWVHYDGRESGAEVLVLASLTAPPTPAVVMATQARRWALAPDALNLLGPEPDDVVLSLSPRPSVLPRCVRPPSAGRISRLGRRFDAELRAAGPLRSGAQRQLDQPPAAPTPEDALNFVEYVARGVAARRRSPSL